MLGPVWRDLDRVENAGPDNGFFTREFTVVVMLRGGESPMNGLLSAHDYRRSK